MFGVQQLESVDVSETTGKRSVVHAQSFVMARLFSISWQCSHCCSSTTPWRRILRQTMNDELEWTYKEAVVALVELLTGHLHRGSEANHEGHRQK